MVQVDVGEYEILPSLFRLFQLSLLVLLKSINLQNGRNKLHVLFVDFLFSIKLPNDNVICHLNEQAKEKDGKHSRCDT
jgi:hypothetical protein